MKHLREPKVEAVVGGALHLICPVIGTDWSSLFCTGVLLHFRKDGELSNVAPNVWLPPCLPQKE